MRWTSLTPQIGDRIEVGDYKESEGEFDACQTGDICVILGITKKNWGIEYKCRLENDTDTFVLFDGEFEVI